SKTNRVKIYLDTRDLINIFERAHPFTADQLNHALREESHHLVLSFHSINELAAPLSLSSSKTNVMKLLNRVEELPIVFLHANIERLELDEAMSALAEKREYRNIDPFVTRFDEAVDLDANPATKIFLKYS